MYQDKKEQVQNHQKKDTFSGAFFISRIVKLS